MTLLDDAPETNEVTDLTAAATGSAPRPSVDEVLAALGRATGRVAPLWELESFVAVNPYLGLADFDFATAADRLDLVAGARSTLPTDYYLDAVAQGRVTREDLAAVLGTTAGAARVDEVLATRDDDADRSPVRTVTDVASLTTGTDWTAYLVERVGAWAGAYFDQGQASWRSIPDDEGLFTAWRAEAAIDRSPAVMGLRGFHRAAEALPATAADAATEAVAALGLDGEALDLYLHALLLRLPGWSAYAARHTWAAALRGEQDDTVTEFLAVLLAWELLVLRCLPDPSLPQRWAEASADLARLADPATTRSPRPGVVLQEAFDRAEERRLLDRLTPGAVTEAADPDRPSAQLVFCIDVRSEVLRRHLEATAPDVETIGFAGFFGIAIQFRPLSHARGVDQCPVLLTPGHLVEETVGDPGRVEEAVAARTMAHHVRRAWKSFKMGAVSCFSFVGPVGLLYLPKLFTDGAGRTRPVPEAEVEGLPGDLGRSLMPRLDPDPDRPGTGIPVDERVAIAEAVLRAMSLTSGFAPLVALTGHGATTVNNPYDKGLDCGACGGHTGEANARVTAMVLNDPAVRAGLAERGIEVPEDTWFLAAQHDTTTDQVGFFDLDALPATHTEHLAALRAALDEAGRRTRRERAARLGLGDLVDGDPAALDAAVTHRSRDWAQVRPEWGLAGCRDFIAAPRHRSAACDLEGRAFLHSYDWRADDGFGVLELIMTAPMVVASWISLQYFGSTVDNELFGSGNKTLHNVTGRIGVLEGYGGDLRSGLPWQSVHDGTDYQHEPLRLNVVIEAPLEAMSDVLRAHPDVRQLVDNGWVKLYAMDDAGRVSHRYDGELRWTRVDGIS